MTLEENPPSNPIVGLTREEYQQLLADQTPNVVLQNPKVRRVLNYTLGLTALVLPIASLVDSTYEQIDWSQPLGLATNIALFLTGALAVGVTARNIPS